MPRYIRNTCILAKIESAYATDAVPTGAANAMLVSDLSINPLQANNVSRELVRPYFGGSEELVGTRYIECGFSVELVGSGTAGTAPAFGPLLRACALAEVLIASTRVDYNPITTGQESVTIYWYDDGVLHKLLGARGTVDFKLGSGERPVMVYKFQGLYGGISAATPSGIDFSAFKTPLVVTDANSGDVTFGGTVSPTGAPAITGGTSIPSMGLEVMLGNTVQFTPLLGGETVDVTQREVTGKARLDLTAAQEVSRMADVLAATLSSMSLSHGLVAGYKVLMHLPSVQSLNPTKEELNGRRLIGYDLRAVPPPAGSGNDELRLVFF
jgi:hypothetical protein